MRARLEVTGATDPYGVPLRLDAGVAGRVRASVLRILTGNVLGAFATVAPDGRAHVHVAYFCVAADLALYFLSSPASKHARNLAANASAAVAIYASSQRWGGPDRGVQLFGTCAVAARARGAEAERLYRHRFPGYARARFAPGDGASGLRFYRFVTRSLRVLDEEAIGDGVLARAVVRRGRARASAEVRTHPSSAARPGSSGRRSGRSP